MAIALTLQPLHANALHLATHFPPLDSTLPHANDSRLPSGLPVTSHRYSRW
jgi:hypothetical protein